MIRENQVIRANLQTDSRESDHLLVSCEIPENQVPLAFYFGKSPISARAPFPRAGGGGARLVR